jgi:hypothetical protein
VGALANCDGDRITLHGQLFDPSGGMVEGLEVGVDFGAVGVALAEKLKEELRTANGE